jgi:ribosomal protein S20
MVKKRITRSKKKITEKKTYNKLRKSKKNHQNLIKAKELHKRKKKYLDLKIKKPLKEIENNLLKEKSPNLVELENLFKQVQKHLDQAAQKGFIHKNKAANKKRKSRKKINELIKQKSLSNPS